MNGCRALFVGYPCPDLHFELPLIVLTEKLNEARVGECGVRRYHVIILFFVLVVKYGVAKPHRL